MLGGVQRRTLILIAAVIGLPAAAGAYLHFTPLALSEVNVSGPASCRPMELPRAPQAAWVQDKLRVEVDVKANCAASSSTLKMQRLGSLLLVRSSTPSPEMSTGCWCSRGYLLETGALPRQDYRVFTYAFP